MKPLSILEYAASILSIVLGLGVAQLLGGVAWVIRHPLGGFWVWLLGGWCLTMLLVIIGWWWGIWLLFQNLEALSFWSFLPAFGVSTLLFVSSRLLVPDMATLDHGVRSHFPEVTRPFFLCIAGVFMLGPVAVPIQGGATEYLLSIEGILTIVLGSTALAAAFVRKPTYHAFILAFWTLAYLAQQALQPDLG